MKYINFKRYKFSTIVKNFNTLIYDFLKIFKSLDFHRYNFLDFHRYNFKNFFKYLDIGRFDFKKITKYINLRRYNIDYIKKIDFFSSKFLLLHIPGAIIFFGFLYLFIPTFYNYDKSNIENAICKKENIECLIRGKVNYSFYPTPRIKIKDLKISGFVEKKNTFITAERAVIKLSIKNLLAKEKHKYKKIKINDFKINFDLQKLKNYKDIFSKKIGLIPLFFTKGEIIFFDGKDYVATINNANINLEFTEDSIDTELKGKFLDDNIYINLNGKKIDDKISTDLILKMSNMNFLTKAHFISPTKEKNLTSGNFLIKKDKNRITAIFDYKDNELIINKSNLRNSFLDGELEGKIRLVPYFDFDLDLNLSSINFTKLYNYFLFLNKNNEKNLFNINKKINGKLNLSSDKIYSNYNLVNSLESRLKFYNGNISIEQLLLNFGKLGAADMLGVIHNNKKFTNFKFESNIFIDNQKKFLSKFGIYNKRTIPSNIFVSGNFDLENIRISFYEISNVKKSDIDDINYIESEFNDLMLADGYKKLFYFPRFKEFIKSVTSENN